MDMHEAIRFVEDNISEEDAFTVLWAMARNFNWAGTMFSPKDVRVALLKAKFGDEADWEDENFDEETGDYKAYPTEYDGIEDDRNNIVDSRMWSKGLEEIITQAGWEMIEEMM